MNKLFVVLVILFIGCKVHYSSPLPETVAGIEADIQYNEKKSVEYEERIKQADKDIAFAQEYLIKNPDTFWNNSGGRMLRSAQIDKDAALFFKTCADDRVAEGRQKLEKLKNEKEME